MKKRNLVAFDFDGTFYPIAPYDSEQLLLRAIAKESGALWAKRAKILICQDQLGSLVGQSWHRRYERFIRKAKPSMVDAVAKRLSIYVDNETKQGLQALSKQADLAVISCGTENLVEQFLDSLELIQYFSLIKAKRIIFNTNEPIRLEINISSAEDKAHLISRLKPSYDKIVAIGDGPTDLPMLSCADLGLIVDWTQSKPSYLYETHPTLLGAIQKTQDYLERACLA